MKITLLDADTLGHDQDLSPFESVGNVTVYPNTNPSEVEARISKTDIVVINKIKLDKTNLAGAKNLKLICVCATGFDNIAIDYCKDNNITVCNVRAYSTNSVAQTTIATVLELATHIRQYSEFVSSGKYSESGSANRLTPVYHDLDSKTWGIIGLGNIGKKVAQIATALGCKIIAYTKNPVSGFDCTDLETLCKNSDIISIHAPLNQETKLMIGEKQLSIMKKNVILYNAARGLITDEAAVARSLLSEEIGAFGSDVYSVEPFPKEHPFYEIKSLPNVCLTPHMAWGSYESRKRCISEVIENIKAFQNNNPRNVL